MPYKGRKSYRRGRKYGRFNNALSGAGTAFSLAKRALKGFWSLKKLINVEHKLNEVKISHDSAASSVDANGQLDQLSQIAEGDDMINRDGRSIKASVLNCHFTLTRGTGTHTALRMIIINDSEYNGALPAIGDILALVAAGSDQNVNAFKRILDKPSQRFKFIKDITFKLDSGSSGTIEYKQSIKLGQHIKYIGTGATAADGGNNQLMILWISNEVLVANSPQVRGIVRLRYIDN